MVRPEKKREYDPEQMAKPLMEAVIDDYLNFGELDKKDIA